MSLYRRLLIQAWGNTWNHKYLWLFGLFAAIAGSSGELNYLFGGFSNLSEKGLFPTLRSFAETGIFSKQAVANLGNILATDSLSLLIALTVLAMVFMLFCFLIWVSIISQGGLVNNVAKAIGNKAHNLKDGLNIGMSKFWPLFGLNVVWKGGIYLLYILVAVPVLFAIYRNSLATGVLYVLAFLLFVPLSIFISFIIKYAICYVVLKNEKLDGALRNGWQLFVKNWLISIEMALLLFAISFTVTVCLLLALMIISIPLFFVAILFLQLQALFYFWFVFISSLILFLVIVVLVGSILSTYQVSAWTGLFVELINKGGVSKIVRIFGKN